MTDQQNVLNWIELYESHFDFLRVYATGKTLGFQKQYYWYLKKKKQKTEENGEDGESGTHKNKKDKTFYF